MKLFKLIFVAPERPTILQQNKLNSTSYMFSWRAPDVTNGDLTSYVISCDPQVNGLGIISQNVSGGDETMATLSGLENGVTYSCSVKAQKSDGSSPPSEPVTFTTDEAGDLFHFGCVFLFEVRM